MTTADGFLFPPLGVFPLLLRVLQATTKSEKADTIQSLQAKVEDLKLTREKALLHSQSIWETDDKSESLSSEGQSERNSIDTTDTPSLENLVESLQGDVEALLELGLALEDPVSDLPSVPEEPASPPKVQPEELPFQPFFEGIKQKYPQCLDSLARWMSKALYETAIRLTEERRAAVSRPPEFFRFTGKLPKDSGYGTSIRDTATHSSVGLQESSVAAGSTYARTLASYDDAGDGTVKTPFPSQPKNLQIGEKFPCIACGRQVAKSERPSAWR